MASVDHLYGDCDTRIIHEIIHTDSIVEAKRSHQYHSVLVIQKAWRGYKIRKDLDNLHEAATTIQKYVRGFLTRINFPATVLKCLEKKTNSYYNKMATRIQALWRGYWTRKHLQAEEEPSSTNNLAISTISMDVKKKYAHYRKHHQNLHSIFEMRKRVAQKNEELKHLIAEDKKKVEEYRRSKMEEESKHMVLYIVFKLHHYMRTHQQEGIYSLHGKNKLSKIEELLNSAKFKNYMTLLKSKYYATYKDVKPKMKIFRKQLDEPPVKHEKPFCLYSKLPPKMYSRDMLKTEKYEPLIVQTRFEDKSKCISLDDFDLTKKIVAPKLDIPPYYIDFWTRGCSIHDLDLIE